MTTSPVQWVHMVGIGGAGMSGIARVLAEQGIKVSGSDLQSSEVTKRLAEIGIIIYQGHAASNLDPGVDLVVVSSAIPQDNSEVIRSQELGIPVIKRGQMLAHIVNGRLGIAVAGAHGKTTTTSMVFLALNGCGLDATFILGGELQGSQLGARMGGSPYCVVEADESDASFLELTPYIGIITNIEDDHLDFYKSMDNLKNAFRQYFACIKPDGFALVCGDDPRIQEILAEGVPCRVVTYGVGEGNDYRYTNWIGEKIGSYCEVSRHKQWVGSMRLSVPGKHNALNALAAVAVAMELRLSFDDAVQALQAFTGAKRRFQLVGNKNDITVVDDYAHHPTEIRATIEAARHVNPSRLVVIFQPHRYTRTQLLGDKLGEALTGADKVVIMDIYSAGEAVIPGVSSDKIYEKASQDNAQVDYIEGFDQVVDHILREARPGDLIITMGAGDVWKLGPEIIEKL